MNRAQFNSLLSLVGLGGDPGLSEKLFYIFDDDFSDTLDYKEVVLGLQQFQNTTFKEKINIFFKLCDLNEDGQLTHQEFYNILKKNMATIQDKRKLKKIVRDIFNRADSGKNNDGVLNN